MIKYLALTLILNNQLLILLNKIQIQNQNFKELIQKCFQQF